MGFWIIGGGMFIITLVLGAVLWYDQNFPSND